MPKQRYINKIKTNNCIINVAIGDFYVDCQKRLVKSIKEFCKADILVWEEEYPLDSPTHLQKPYAFKPYAFMVAKKLGYKNVLWLDSIIELVKPIEDIFSIISVQDYFFIHNGWPLGEWVKDDALDFFSVTRDDAMNFMDNSANIMGINVESKLGYKFLEEWFCIAKNTDLFCGSKDNDDLSNSKDKRCKGHRHDQSIASLLSMKMNMNRFSVKDFLYIHNDKKQDLSLKDEIFICKRYL